MDRTKISKLKTWLERFQKRTELVYELDIEPTMTDTEIREQKYIDTEKRINKFYGRYVQPQYTISQRQNLKLFQKAERFDDRSRVSPEKS